MPGKLLFSWLIFFPVSIILFSCNSEDKSAVNKRDSLTDAQQRLPENALKGLTVANDLEVHTFATEPLLKNPTNIDVDERGRVWVCEAYNYRPAINGNPTNPKGDRIMILEDTNGDGIADTAKVFYQGPEINAPLGICVLGHKLIVSQSPNVWIFYDDNGDDKADRKELLFSGISGEQHDHGVHAFTFGPDGKLYFNFGNAGEQLKDKNGRPVLDQDGQVIDQKTYRQGMVFRCDTDGTHVECLGQNFRNPYEVAVDSYGSLWQSDNDDDGNRGTRINYVMEYGNYGYKDEITGEGWGSNRTNIEDSIPLRHWHLNDPGVVPNLLQTFAGSPTGIMVYEGDLLPKEFHDELIHCDAGPNVVRSYTVQKQGAGYSATIINILQGEKDKWFRPVDVCAAPDGSLMIADWYDPGVGGHQAGDQTRGRIYRVSPPHVAYTIPKFDYSTAAGAVHALQNPNLSVRYHAFSSLQQMGAAAIPELEKLWKDANANPRMRARAFWVLAKMKRVNTAGYIGEAIKDANADLRITGLRAARELNSDVIGIISKLVNDTSPQVRRECAIALHHNKSPEVAALWTTLATQYDGKDRWYLEALGIGADKQWDPLFEVWLAKIKDPLQSDATRNIVWRARTDKSLPYLAKLASDSHVPLANRLKYFRAFDFNAGNAKYALLLDMLKKNPANDVAFNKVVLHALDIKTVMGSPVARKALNEVLQTVYRSEEYIELISRFKLSGQNDKLLQLAISKPNDIGESAVGLLLQQNAANILWNVINGRNAAEQDSLVQALSGVGSSRSVDMLQQVALSPKYAMPLRKKAASQIGYSGTGEDRVLQLLKAKKVPQELLLDMVKSVQGAWRKSVRLEAASYLPEEAKALLAKPAPPLSDLLALKANAADGKKIFESTCSSCHRIKNEGHDFGPNLSEIGGKLPKEALYTAIVQPSAGIGFGYEGYTLTMKDGSILSGIFASKTETDLDIKFPGGSRRQLKTSDVKTMVQMKQSMMTEGLYSNWSAQDFANLLEYLEGLKKN